MNVKPVGFKRLKEIVEMRILAASSNSAAALAQHFSSRGYRTYWKQCRVICTAVVGVVR